MRAEQLSHETRKRVLGHLRELGRRAISIHDLIKELKLPADDARPLRHFLKSLVRQGRLDTRRRGKYILTQNIHEPMAPAPEEAPKAQRPAFAPDWDEGEATAVSKQPSRRGSRRRRDEEGEAKPQRGAMLLPAALDALEVEAFPLEVIQEAQEASAWDLEQDLQWREDLRHLPLFTIDGVTAKDFDDAVGLIEFPEEGIRRVVVAIADVAHYVKEGTALDKEAGRRATSVYLPQLCFPMLPEALSNGACSLRPQEDRLSLAVFLDFNQEGDLVHSELHEAIICSRARLTYTEVSRFLHFVEEAEADARERGLQEWELEDVEGADAFAPSLFALTNALKGLDRLTSGLRKKRMRRGALEIDAAEPSFVFDEKGQVDAIKRTERNRAHFLIEELMLKANEAVAAFLLQHDLPGIFRNHGHPSEEKLEQLVDVLSQFGITSGSLGVQIDEFGVPQPIAISPQRVTKTIEKFGDHPARQLFQHWLLRCMKQAVYEPENKGHFGLALEHYLHFTSPIRRYPDLCVHRVVKLYLRDQLTAAKRSALFNAFGIFAEHSSLRERLAVKAEREAIAQQQALFMVQHIGETLTGVVASVVSFGCFIKLDDFFVEGLMHISQFQGHYDFDEYRLTLTETNTGHSFKMGDRVKVVVEHASPTKGQIDLGFVETLP